MTPEQDLIQFVQTSLMDPIVEYLTNSTGESFAQFVFDGWPARLKPLQAFTHHQMPGMQGAPVIVELFKHSDVWHSQLAHREAEFKQFVEDFCKWRPEGEQPAAPADSTEPESWESTEEVKKEDKG